MLPSNSAFNLLNGSLGVTPSAQKKEASYPVLVFLPGSQV